MKLPGRKTLTLVGFSALFLVIASVRLGRWEEMFWVPQWAALSVMGGLYVSSVVSGRFNCFCGALCGYLVVSGLLSSTWLGVSPDILSALFQAEGAGKQFTVYLKRAESVALVKLLLSIIFVLSISWVRAELIARSLAILALVTSLAIVVGSILHAGELSEIMHRVGYLSNGVAFFNNASMGGSFIALCLPLWLRWPLGRAWKRAIIFSQIIAIVLTGARAPWLVAAIALLPWFSRKQVVSGLMLLVPSAVGWLVARPSKLWFDGTGRFEFWRMMMRFWSEHHGWFLGLGLGSGSMYFPQIQAMNGENVDHGAWLLFLHNDWLQLTFECGLIGLVLGCGAFYFLCGTRDKYLRAGVLAYGACMFINFPLHWPLHAFLGLIYVKLASMRYTIHPIIVPETPVRQNITAKTPEEVQMGIDAYKRDWPPAGYDTQDYDLRKWSMGWVARVERRNSCE